MELLQLKYFCDAAQSENFSKTAKKFSVPPSDISQSIRRLERELETELFLRGANCVRLNRRGRIFYEKARDALLILDRAVAAVKDEEEKGEISLCINANRRIVMQAVEIFQKSYPEIGIKTAFFQNPAEGEFDFVIATEPLADGNLSSQKLLEEPLAIALHRSFCTAKQPLSVSELKEMPFITTGENNHLYALTRSLCEKEGFTPRIAVRSDDPYYIRKCVEMGLGVSLVPTVSWKGQFSDQVVLIPLKGETRTTYLYFEKEKYSPMRNRRFEEILLSLFRREEGDGINPIP
ncbi:MAG: LysR family transcriptional regulator [Clostridia bacterium]|nr:LysR family transcriptional regulator [Clostridia bacterium]